MSIHPVLEGREPQVALSHFSNFLMIPRQSGKEGGVVKYVQNWAAWQQFRTTSDSVGNIVTYVPASPGYESAPVACLQGHMDMVYVPDDPAIIQQPIDIEVDGDWVQSKGKTRTLGADNAAALVLAMDLVETVPHGPLELLFTADEEVGMSGAEAFKPENHDMKSRWLINIDTPEFRRIAVMSAGFQYVEAEFPLSCDPAPAPYPCYRLSLTGFAGGHSGDCVGLNRGNAIKTLGAMLELLPHGSALVSIKGGAAGNSIPAEAEAVISIPGDEKAWLRPLVDLLSETRKKLVRPEIRFTTERVEKNALSPFSPESHSQFVKLLTQLPSGVLQWSDIPGLPELSTTLATVKEEGSVLKFVQIVRGAVEGIVQSLASNVKGIYEAHDCITSDGHHGVGWKQEPGSPLVAATLRGFEKIGQPAELKGYHCGLELASLIGDPENPNFDAAVSLGCQVDNEHGVDERMSLSSMVGIREVLRLLLLDIAEGRVA